MSHVFSGVSSRITILLAVLSFVATAGVVACWGHRDRTRAPAVREYTATAYVVEHAGSPGGAELRIPMCYTDADARRAERVADSLAERYVEDRRAEWDARKAAAESRAAEALAKARQQYAQSQARLESFRRQMDETKRAAQARVPVSGATVDNPQWVELSRQLAELVEQHDKLLADRTPVHPAVQEVTGRIDDLKREMANVPRQVPALDERGQSPPRRTEGGQSHFRSDENRDSPRNENRDSPQELAALIAAVEASQRKLDETERLANDKPASITEYSIVQAEAVEGEVAAADGDVPAGVLSPVLSGVVTPVLSGMLMAVGVGMIFAGGSIRPVSGTSGQVQADAHITVIGHVPADDPMPDPMARYQRQCRVRRSLLWFGLLLVAACPLAAVWAITTL